MNSCLHSNRHQITAWGDFFFVQNPRKEVMSPPWTSPETYGLSTPWFPLVWFGLVPFISLRRQVHPLEAITKGLTHPGGWSFLLWELLDFGYTLSKLNLDTPKWLLGKNWGNSPVSWSYLCKYFLSEKMISVMLMFANLATFLSVQLWSTRFVVQMQETCTRSGIYITH